MKLALKFLHDESGATAIEYGLIGSMIFLAIVVSVRTLGGKLPIILGRVTSNLS